MSWITIIWSMAAAVCLTLAGLYVLIWFKQTERRDYALFVSTALAAAVLAAYEAALMRATTVTDYGNLLRWAHIPFAVLIFSIVWFLHFHLHAGRLWLAWLVCGLRALALALNFVFEPNLNYREITSLWQLDLLGESVSVPVGVTNAWTLIGHLSMVLLVVYCLDATRTTWRRGDRRAALLVGGSVTLFVALSLFQLVLVMWGYLEWPFFHGLAFVGIVLAMGFELSSNVARAARLAAALQRSEAALRTSHEQMNLAASAAKLGLWQWDMPEDEVWASQELQSLLGFAPDERITSTTFLAHVHPDDRDRTDGALRHSLETGADYTSEYRVVLPDGTQRWIAARGRTQVRGADGAVRMLGVCIDITERKRALTEVVRQRNELAHFNRLATMGELTATLAHELRQPIGAILHNAEAAELLLRDGATNVEEFREIIADIRADDQRAAAVIDRARAMLRHGEPAFTPLDINELLSGATALIQSEAERRAVRIHVDVAPSIPRIPGDRVQLQQVLTNLIVNAMDSMSDVPAERRRLAVRAQRDGENAVKIAVIDSGPGVPAGRLTKIFEPFFTSKTGGLGMGLAISRSIIEAHGGRLGAENSPGGGAVFCFTVPVTTEGASP